MGRFIIIPGIDKEPDRGLNPDADQAVRQKLIDFLKSLRELTKSWVDVHPILTEFNDWVKASEKVMMAENVPELFGFQSRIGSHTLKLAVLLAVSELGAKQKYVLTNDHLKKATILGKWLIDQAVTLAETGFIKSKTEVMVQKLLQAARSNGGVQRRDAIRFLHLSSRDFDQVVITAVERGELRVEKEKGTTKPSLYYRAAGKLPKEGD